MEIDVDDLLFDDESESKFAAHGLGVADVLEVYDYRPRFYVNRPGRRATHVMMGPTRGGRLLVVPIEPLGSGLWRAITAFEPTKEQAARYRRRRA